MGRFKRARNPGLRRWLLLAAAGALVAMGGACSDDEASDEELAEVENTVSAVLGATSDSAEEAVTMVTDNLIEKVLFSNREDCEANAAECIGDPIEIESFEDTEIDGDEASTTITAEFGTLEVDLVREDDAWLVDSMSAASDELPDGAEEVDLRLVDFGFEFEEGDIPDDGNFAFNVSNEGDQPHEVLVFPIGGDGELSDVLEELDAPPAAVKVFVQPGQEDIAMAFQAPLEAGRYALVCFFPDTEDPEGTPHAVKGMVAEFTIE